jgi:hypothetical protein
LPATANAAEIRYESLIEFPASQATAQRERHEWLTRVAHPPQAEGHRALPVPSAFGDSAISDFSDRILSDQAALNLGKCLNLLTMDG